MILEDQKKAEEKILNFWKEKKIPERVRKLRKRAKRFFFVDGPPYATGSIHMGTALNKILKDTYIRFWRMSGFNVWDQPGYDTHGLPIENKVEEILGLKMKSDIEKFGIDKFIEECRKFSTKYIGVMSEQFNDLGVWFDWDNPYLTLTNDYIEGAWFTFQRAFEKGLLYKGIYPVHVCPRCVDLDSVVLVKDGAKKIRELKDCWRHHLPIVFDENNRTILSSEFGGYVEFDEENTFAITTASGRKIITTLDHPFFVKGKGWTELKYLMKGDCVAVYPSVRAYDEDKSGGVLNKEEVLKILENLELLSGFKSVENGEKLRELTTTKKEEIIKTLKKLRQDGLSYTTIIKEIERVFNIKVSKGWIAKVIKDGIKLRTENIIKELEDKKLFPIDFSSSKLPILVRIMGHLFGGGSLILKKRVGKGKNPYFCIIDLVFTGRDEDLETIKKDLSELGFRGGKIIKRKCLSIVNRRKVVGTSTSFRMSNLPLGVFLIALGAPIGRKSENLTKIPSWIINGSKKIKKEFLSAYFGSELQIIRPRKYGKGFDMIRLYIYKDKKLEENAVEFANTLIRMIKDFGVKARMKKRTRVVNGKERVEIALEILPNDENVLNFCERIGYVYCKYREVRAKLVYSYLKYKLALKEKLKQKKKKILFLKGRGFKPNLISQKLDLPIRYVRYVYYKPDKITRASKYVPSFQDWVEEFTDGLNDGITWDIVERIAYSGRRKTADVFIKNFHNFIVNEFITHNCQTAVAYNELDYQEIDDIAVYVKFQLKNRRNEYLVIWTTTPWTLPANTGVMAKPDADYVKVRVGNDILILAERLLVPIMDKLGVETYSVIETLKGRDLNGYEYLHPLADFFDFQRALGNAHRVVLSDQYVNLEEGTGLVHTAPGHGQEDFKVGQETGLPAVSPVKIDGTYDERCGKFSGMFVKDADPLILEELEKRGLLLYKEKIRHEYPHCWRCESPLLLISLPQWFFKVTEMRDKLIEENKRVKWYPSWAGQRFQNWLESLGDWPISRQRYWGIPLPIWICEKCQDVRVIGSRKELGKIPKDFHRPHIDEITLKCEKCKGKMKRVPDVLDVWFDSGVCSWASLGYPSKKQLFEEMWPSDLNLEGPDQIRGWWNSELITSVITFDRAPFKAILFHGFVLDAHGIKMSKSKGNIITPQEIIKEYGRDVLRTYLLSSPPWDDFYFNMADVKDVAKQFNIIRNTFNFINTYVTKFRKPRRLEKEDKWILSRMNSLMKNYMEHFRAYNGHKAVQETMNFILNDLSRWYIKLVRDRTWPLYTGKDKDAAFYALVIVTENLVKLLAPICPFIAEDAYQNVFKKFKKGLDSVHMYTFPKPDEKLIDKKLEEQMEVVKVVAEASNAARQKVNLKLRWPVKRLFVVTKDKKIKSAVKALENILLNSCNVKSVKVVSKEPKGNFVGYDFERNKVLLDLTEDKEMYEDRLYRELTRKIQDLRKQYKFVVSDRIKLTLKSEPSIEEILRKFVEKIKKDVGAETVEIGVLKGKNEGELVFQNKKVEIKFE